MSNCLWPHGLNTPWNSPGQNIGMGSLSLLQGIFPTQGSNPGLPCCRRILYQLSHKGSPRILEWVAYPFSSGSSQPGIKLVSPALQVYSLPTEKGNIRLPEFKSWLHHTETVTLGKWFKYSVPQLPHQSKWHKNMQFWGLPWGFNATIHENT